MNTILLSFAIVITLVNLALALSTFGYIVEMNKHMEEWFKMFKELVEICGDICYGNAHTIENVTKYTEYMKNMFIKKDKDIQDLNDKYDKLYEEFKKLEEKLDESTYHYIKDVLDNEVPKEDYHKYVLESPFWETDPDGDIFRVHLKEGTEDENQNRKVIKVRGNYKQFLEPEKVENKSEPLEVRLTGISKLVPGESKSKVMEGYKFEIVGGQND